LLKKSVPQNRLEVHACGLMKYHFHLADETPQGNLAAGGYG
jgi:hypothetical protein